VTTTTMMMKMATNGCTRRYYSRIKTVGNVLWWLIYLICFDMH